MPVILIPRVGPISILRPRRSLLVFLTRFYLPSTGAAAVSPAFDVGWEDTSIASRLATVTTRINSVMTTVSFTDLDGTDRDILFRQWVSARLDGAFAVPADLVFLQMRGLETLATQDMFLTWSVKVVSEDGLTVRGTVLAIRRDGAELDTVLTNRSDIVAGASVSALNGDRFVFEIGTGGDPLVSHDSDLSIGDDSSTDLPQDDIATAADNPWIELPGRYAFQAEVAGAALIGGLALFGVGR